MIKAVIIDDEKQSRIILENLLKEFFPEITISGQADNVKSGLSQISQHKPDIVLLDIEMPDGTGFDLLKQIKEPTFSVIFATAFNEYALKAFRFSAVDYLLKPICENEFKQAVKKSIRSISDKQNLREQTKTLVENYQNHSGNILKLVLSDHEGFQVIPLADIVRLQGERNYTRFILTDKRSLLSSRTLSYFEELLEKQSFIRIFKSHIVNLDHVVRYTKTDGGSVITSDNAQLSISNSKKEEFKKRFLS